MANAVDDGSEGMSISERTISLQCTKDLQIHVTQASAVINTDSGALARRKTSDCFYDPQTFKALRSLIILAEPP